MSTRIDGVSASAPAPAVGHLAGVGPAGEILVRSGDGEPAPARLVAGLDRSLLARPEMAGSEVLLLFIDNDPQQPVILGLLAEEHPEADLRQAPDEIRVDGHRLHLEAYDEIVLRCGESSVKLRADGKITIKGKNLLSRATGTHRIKGGSVDIN
jgi:hypothetical protein